MEDGQEAPGDEVEDPTLVRREVGDVVRDVGRDDRVVVVDPGVVDDALKRQLVEAEHVARARRIVRDRRERLGGRLQLRNEVAGEIARVRPRVRDRLLALVQRLGGAQRPPGGEPVAAVGVPL
jgi:hypothetical protein